MDQREYPAWDWEETIRTAFAGLMAGQWHAMPGIVVQDSTDMHNAVVQIPIKRMVTDAETGERSFESHPIHPDVIIHFPGGAGATYTHGISRGDEGLLIYANRDVDSWRQSGGEQIPVSNRMSGYQDPHLIPGVRSDPRKLEQVDPKALHARSDDKTAVHEVKPGVGVQSFHADPGTAPASATFDPLTMATKYVRHLSWSSLGAIGQAVDGGTIHDHGSHHDVGSWLQSFGGRHKVVAGVAGAILSAFDGQHTVNADASGVQISSPTGVSISCPPGTLSLPKGGVSGGSIQTGGDISGTADQAKVISILNVTGADKLPQAANDAAAAALVPPVPIGALYRNGSALMVRVA